jgi:hypothetical protein
MTTATEGQQKGIVDQWTALAWVLGHDESKMGKFMFMGTAVGRSGQTIYLYKHVDTRNYINADLGGNCYAYNSEHLITGANSYHDLGQEAAIAHAFRLTV